MSDQMNHPACIDRGRVRQAEADRTLQGRDQQLLLNKPALQLLLPTQLDIDLLPLAHLHANAGAGRKEQLGGEQTKEGGWWWGLVATILWSSSICFSCMDEVNCIVAC